MSEISKNLQELKKNISALTEFSVGKNSFLSLLTLKIYFMVVSNLLRQPLLSQTGM